MGNGLRRLRTRLLSSISFVMQLAEDGVQYLVNKERKFIYLDWFPGQKTRRVKLNFICSNRCCKWWSACYVFNNCSCPVVETETEYYINLRISLEESISGDVKGYDTVAVIPP